MNSSKAKHLMFFVSIGLCSLCSCVVAPQRFYDVVPRYGITEYRQDISRTEGVHYSPDAMKKWNIGVINTENALISDSVITKNKERMLKYGDGFAALDLDKDFLNTSLFEALSDVFGHVERIDDVASDSGKHDGYVYIDTIVTLGSMSGKMTSVDLTLYFVNKDNRYLGKVVAHGESVVPYPADNYGFTKAAVNMFVDLKRMASSGIWLMSM